MEHKSKFWLQTKTQDNHQSSCSHDLDDILVKQGSKEQSCDDQISVALLILSSVQAVTANIGRIISCSRSFKTTVETL